MRSNILSKWGKGLLFCASGLDCAIDYKRQLILRSSLEDGVLELKYPAACGRLLFFGIGKERYLASDAFIINGATGVFVNSTHLLIEGDVSAADISDDFRVAVSGSRTLVGVADGFDEELITTDIVPLLERSKKFFSHLDKFENVSETEYNALASAFSQVKSQIYSPVPEIPFYWSTPDRWPHRHMWLWDSVFHAIGVRHFSPSVARDLISAVFVSIQEDGMIPHMFSPTLISKVTQPPVLGFGIKLVYESEQNIEWLVSLYPLLSRYLDWVTASRDSNGNCLVEWTVEKKATCRCGESGMDNSPRFDTDAVLDAVDYSSFLSLEYECMAEFAAILGKTDDVVKWSELHNNINAAIDKLLWCEEDKFYFDRNTVTGEFSKIAASSGLLPLICGAASEEHAAVLVEKLNDPEEFGTPCRIPSISVKFKQFYEKDMWRGPVWININYLVALGLERYGYSEEAEKLLRETVDMESRYVSEYATFFEFYDDKDECPPTRLARKGKWDPYNYNHQPYLFYGWSATLYIDMIKRLSVK